MLHLRPPVKSTEERLATREAARKVFLENVPDELTNLVGRQNAKRGAIQVGLLAVAAAAVCCSNGNENRNRFSNEFVFEGGGSSPCDSDAGVVWV
jgi:hypothetical protein